MRAAIIAVNYNDLLAVTMPAWKAMLPAGSLCVVTSPEDREAVALCQQHGVEAVQTDVWTKRDPTYPPTWNPDKPITFNSAWALDVALGLVDGPVKRPAVGDVICAINADCYPMGQWPDTSALEMDTIYGIERHACETPERFADVLAGRVRREDVRRMKNSGGRPVGYFQLARYREGLRFGSFPTGQKYDTHFWAKFSKQAYFSDIWLWHLGTSDPSNWAGRTAPRWEGVPA